MKNLKKENVYVVVDTPKQAKKLKKVLEMFGEKYGSCTFELLENKEGDKVYFNMGSEWNVDTVPMIHRSLQEVSIKELRNILAKEHLIEGDVVVAGIDKNRYLVKFESFRDCGNFLGYYTNLENSYKLTSFAGGFKNFIRYATVEEKALLEPKKELEVGKWYKGNVDIESLIFITEIENTGSYNNIHGYGFKHGQWNDLSHLFSNTDHEKSLIEATPQEVEKALIEEAERRYKVGNIVNQLDVANIGNYPYAREGSNFKIRDINEPLLRQEDEESFFYLGNLMVFKNGVWADVIEQSEVVDKFAELKEAHRNGKVIQINNIYGGWADVVDNSDLWLANYEYRIKPEVEPKPNLNIGDVVKLNNSQVAVVRDFKEAFRWRFCTKLSKEEAVELLFGANKV